MSPDRSVTQPMRSGSADHPYATSRTPWLDARVHLSGAALALAAASACIAPPVQGPPARIVIGTQGSLVVNNRRAVQIPVRVLDADGRVMADTGLRYQWMAGDSIPVSATGMVTCTKRADAHLRVSLGRVATRVLLRCRPVRIVHAAGPMQFILGDSSQEMPLQVVGVDGEPVDSFAMAVTFRSSVVAVHGLRLQPLAIDGTVATVRVGDESASFGIHVYERVGTLAGLRPDQRFAALPLQLASGEVHRWPLPAGQWMFTMMPYEDEARGLRLRIEGAVCMPATLTRRRLVCEAHAGFSVMVYHPSTRSAPALSGTLLVRRVNS